MVAQVSFGEDMAVLKGKQEGKRATIHFPFWATKLKTDESDDSMCRDTWAFRPPYFLFIVTFLFGTWMPIGFVLLVYKFWGHIFGYMRCMCF